MVVSIHMSFEDMTLLNIPYNHSIINDCEMVIW